MASIIINIDHVNGCICGCVPESVATPEEAVVAVAYALQGQDEYYGVWKPVARYMGGAQGIVDGAYAGIAYQDGELRISARR